MVNIVLVEPEIPQNCGNIARTCAVTGSRLHLIRPLGFDISEKADLWLATTKAPRDYTQASFREGCWLFFGKETAGLPAWLRERYPERCLRIPMRGEVRSLNLSNAAAVLTYEALRQQGFPGLSSVGEMGERPGKFYFLLHRKKDERSDFL